MVDEVAPSIFYIECFFLLILRSFVYSEYEWFVTICAEGIFSQFVTCLYFIIIIIFIYLFIFLAALGLCCCTQAFSSCDEWGLLFVVVCGLLIVVSSLVAEHRL